MTSFIDDFELCMISNNEEKHSHHKVFKTYLPQSTNQFFNPRVELFWENAAIFPV